MPNITIDDFRTTVKITKGERVDLGEEVYSYWNNQEVESPGFNRDEILHIRKSRDGRFYLEIANTIHRGSLAELEEKLFEWSQAEGWFC